MTGNTVVFFFSPCAFVFIETVGNQCVNTNKLVLRLKVSLFLRKVNTATGTK